ncbi:hypothetical protein HBB16_09480 [Pseudonocardia sp. MCCB 268]|nr:hypothetical protein [Pseudonocardia cytotoxica]
MVPGDVKGEYTQLVEGCGSGSGAALAEPLDTSPAARRWPRYGEAHRQIAGPFARRLSLLEAFVVIVRRADHRDQRLLLGTALDLAVGAAPPRRSDHPRCRADSEPTRPARCSRSQP